MSPRLLLPLLLLLAPAWLRAQSPSLARVPVTATGSVSGNNAILYLDGQILAQGTGSVGAAGSWNLAMQPGRIYYASTEVDDLNQYQPGVDFGAFDLTFKAPPGYTVWLQPAYTTDPLTRTPRLAATSSVPSSGTIKWAIQLRADGWDVPAMAGRLTQLSVGDLVLEFGLGTLANGKSAGRLGVRSPGLAGSWAPSSLVYASPDGTAQLTQAGSDYTLSLPQVKVVAAAVSSTKETISFYAWDAGVNGYAAGAYAGYTLEKAASGLPAHAPPGADGLKLTAVQGTGAGQITVVRWVFFDPTSGAWTLIEGTGGDERIETHSSSTSGGIRTETVTVQDSSLATKAKSRRKWDGLHLTENAEWSDPGSASPDLTTSYDYYGAGSPDGDIGQLQKITYPNGATEAYDYYDSGAKLGQLQTVTKPWSTGATDYNQVTTYDYDGPTGKYASYLASTTVTVNGTTVAKTTTDSVSFGASDYTRTTKGYTDSTHYLTTTTRTYRQDAAYWQADRPLSIKRPDGRQTGWYYEHSGANYTTWTVNGTKNSGAGITTTSSINGKTFADAIGLLANASTLTEAVRDGQDNLVSQKTWVWNGSSWDTGNPIVNTTTSWSDAVHTSGQTALNGAQTDWTWQGTYLASKKDPAGIQLTYAYDSAGRVAGVAQAGAATTSYTYFPTNLQKSLTEAGGALTRTTTYDYDGAGRPTGSTLPDGRTMSASYSILSGGITQTVETLSCGGTITTQKLKDGKLKQVTGDTRVDQYYSYGVDGAGRITTRIDYAGSSSSRWEKTTTDWLGRTVTQIKPGYTGQPDITVATTYDGTTGLPTKISRTGLADEYRSYDDLGRLIRNGLDLGNNGSLSPADSADRVTDYAAQFSKSGADWWLETTRSIYPTDATAVVTGREWTRLSGFAANTLAEAKQEDSYGNQAGVVTTVDRASRQVTVTTTYPGVSATAQTVATNGLTTSQAGTDGRSVTSTYDDLGRLYQQTDSRTGATTYTYLTHSGNDTDQVATVTDPAGAVTTYGYDSGGRVASVENASGDYAYYTYDCRGRLTRQWGGAVAPVEQVYDDYSQVTALHSYRGGTWTGSTWPGGTADTTTYTYDGPSGLLTGRTDAASHTVNYTYNDRGLVATRAWARLNSSSQRVTTTYSYLAGTTDLTGKSYNDGTPDVAFTYTRMGQLASATDVDTGSDTETRTFGYNSHQQLQTETLPSHLGGRVLTYTYQDGTGGTVAGRSSGYELGTSASPWLDLVIGLGYDSSTGNVAALTATLNGVSQRTFAYTYAGNTSLVTGISQSGLGYSQSRSYEPHRDLLTQAKTGFGSTTWGQYDHTYNPLGQRDSAKQSGSAFADYGDATFYRYTYDSRGQLQQAAGYLGGDVNIHGSGNALPERDFEYGYDQAGNRTSANRSGIAALAASYTINALNQITARDNPYVTVWATADPGAKVLINGNLAGQRGNYWAGEATLANTGGPAQGDIPVKAATASPQVMQVTSVHGVLAQDPETLGYDADGNLTADGLWDYTYDAENRLIKLQTGSAAITAGLPGQRLVFRYDSLGRRTGKELWIYSASTWTQTKDLRFIYQGWNLIAELTPVSGPLSLVRSYVWGLDIAGSLSATGGVGALLQITDYTGSTTSYLPGYDGSGNLAVLVKDDGTLSATYEYSPFGESLRKEGTYAKENPFRFSTKYTDEDTGLVYYGHRYYSPSLGRFLNQDPIGVSGGINLYAFVQNDPANRWDVLGNQTYEENSLLWQTFVNDKDWIVNADTSAQSGGMVSFMGFLVPSRVAASYGPFALSHGLRSGDLNAQFDALLRSMGVRDTPSPAVRQDAANIPGGPDVGLAILSFFRKHFGLATVTPPPGAVYFGKLQVVGPVPGPVAISSDNRTPWWYDSAMVAAVAGAQWDEAHAHGISATQAIANGFSRFSGTFAAYETIATVVANVATMFVGPETVVARKVVTSAAETAANPIPGTMARVIPNGTTSATLGRAGATDVFVTAADDIAGMNSAQIAQRLAIRPSPTGYQVIEFPTPGTGVASPVLRPDPGFIGGGRTLGGAREFVIPNQPIPPGATVRIVPPGGG